MRSKEEWLENHDNPGLSHRYWVVAWGGHIRGPYKKQDVEDACKDAYGMVDRAMLVADLGTRVAPVRTTKFHRVCRELVELQEKGHAGIFQVDWSSGEVGKIADWRDDPFVRTLDALQRRLAQRDPREEAFERRAQPLAAIEDTDQAVRAVKELWRGMFEADPDSDPRFAEHMSRAGYEWPLPEMSHAGQ